MTWSLTFRSARSAERPALEALQRRASLANPGDREAILLHPDAIHLPPDHIADDRVVVAEVDGIIGGFATVVPRDDGDAELDALFVEPNLWRRGIGSGLLNHCAESARALGATSLHVVDNPHAERFYLQCGFLHTGMIETRFGPGLQLRKAL